MSGETDRKRARRPGKKSSRGSKLSEELGGTKEVGVAGEQGTDAETQAAAWVVGNINDRLIPF